jgi:hypothetical protein
LHKKAIVIIIIMSPGPNPSVPPSIQSIVSLLHLCIMILSNDAFVAQSLPGGSSYEEGHDGRQQVCMAAGRGHAWLRHRRTLYPYPGDR